MITANNGTIEIHCDSDAIMCQDATDVIRVVKAKLSNTYGQDVAKTVLDGILEDANKPRYEANKQADDFAKACAHCMAKIQLS